MECCSVTLQTLYSATHAHMTCTAQHYSELQSDAVVNCNYIAADTEHYSERLLGCFLPGLRLMKRMTSGLADCAGSHEVAIHHCATL